MALERKITCGMQRDDFVARLDVERAAPGRLAGGIQRRCPCARCAAGRRQLGTLAYPRAASIARSVIRHRSANGRLVTLHTRCAVTVEQVAGVGQHILGCIQRLHQVLDAAEIWNGVGQCAEISWQAHARPDTYMRTRQIGVFADFRIGFVIHVGDHDACGQSNICAIASRGRLDSETGGIGDDVAVLDGRMHHDITTGFDRRCLPNPGIRDMFAIDIGQRRAHPESRRRAGGSTVLSRHLVIDLIYAVAGQGIHAAGDILTALRRIAVARLFGRSHDRFGLVGRYQ